MAADRLLWNSGDHTNEVAYILVERKHTNAPANVDLGDQVKVTKGKFETYAGVVIEFDKSEGKDTVTLECEVKST